MQIYYLLCDVLAKINTRSSLYMLISFSLLQSVHVYVCMYVCMYFLASILSISLSIQQQQYLSIYISIYYNLYKIIRNSSCLCNKLFSSWRWGSELVGVMNIKVNIATWHKRVTERFKGRDRERGYKNTTREKWIRTWTEGNLEIQAMIVAGEQPI